MIRLDEERVIQENNWKKDLKIEDGKMNYVQRAKQHKSINE